MTKSNLDLLTNIDKLYKNSYDGNKNIICIYTPKKLYWKPVSQNLPVEDFKWFKIYPIFLKI